MSVALFSRLAKLTCLAAVANRKRQPVRDIVMTVVAVCLEILIYMGVLHRMVLLGASQTGNRT